MSTTIHIRDFTDPACPFAYSLEPVRWRLKWLYGNAITWQSSMIVLHESVEGMGGLTPEILAKTRTRLQQFYGMPINDSPPPRLSPSIEVCRAYIAVSLNSPAHADTILRQFRIAIMNGALPDDREVINSVITDAGIKQDLFDGWLQQTGVEAFMRNDMREAREPSRVALALAHKLGRTPEHTKRYSAGSYVFSKEDEMVFELPGFWPAVTYEAVMANLAPDVQRSDDATHADKVLEWAGEPLATAEVAAIMNKPLEEVRTELQQVATMQPVGQDGFWMLTG